MDDMKMNKDRNAIDGKTPERSRQAVLERLARGEINVETASSLLGDQHRAGVKAPISDEQLVRMNILERIELGEMEADEALEYLESQSHDGSRAGGRLDLLQRIDEGSLTAEDALQLLDAGKTEAENESQPVSSVDEQAEPARERLRSRARWGLLAVSVGFSAVGGWLASLGGWWWTGAAPLLLLGVPLLVLVVVSWHSVWLFVNIHTAEEWPKQITICFPVPLRLAGWVIRSFGGWMPGLSSTAVDELLVELEEKIHTSQPVAIDIDETETGERVQVYLG